GVSLSCPGRSTPFADDGQSSFAPAFTANAHTPASKVGNCRLALNACQRSNRWKMSLSVSSSTILRSAGCHGAIAKLMPAALTVESAGATPRAPATYTRTARLEDKPRAPIAAAILRTGPPIPNEALPQTVEHVVS